MITISEGDSNVRFPAVFLTPNKTRVDVSSGTLSGFFIAPDGTRTAIVPVFDVDAAGDGTDGAVVYAGTLTADLDKGLHYYTFLADISGSYLSTAPIPFMVRTDA